MYANVAREAPQSGLIPFVETRPGGSNFPGLFVPRPPVEKIQSRARFWRYRGKAIVDGALAANAEFSAIIRHGLNERGELTLA